MLKSIIILIQVFFLIPVTGLNATGNFSGNFINRTLRIDYFHMGNAKNESFSIDKIYIEGEWSGSKKNLIYPFKYGRYRYEIYSVPGDELIFSKGFDSYFGEYSTTGEALRGIKRTYHESALIPLPKGKISFRILKKDRYNRYRELYRREIDPGDRNISLEKRYGKLTLFNLWKSGPPERCVDIAIIAEGYREEEKDKVKADLARAKDIFFSQEPYKSLKSKFNIYGVFKASSDSGPDEPRQRIYKKSALDTSFNSLNSPRYLLTESNRKLRDIASFVPYDALIIMVNSKRYGGGGIFNLYCTFTAHNSQTPYLLLHEFGHSFSGLADEYYSSAISYNEFYPRGVEPDEPNITALADPSNVKWKKMITKGVPVPTPWNKSEFDKMNSRFSKKRGEINKKIESLIKNGADGKAVEVARDELNDLINRKEIEDRIFFSHSHNRGIVGAFKGAGYSSEGLYRPMLDCIMFTIGKKPYCRVCRSAVEDMIGYFTE